MAKDFAIGKTPYRGRIAPSPTGLLHLGHARTFLAAQERARKHGGTLILRMEDLDGPRSRREFVEAAIEDLHWIGIHWEEGPDIGGPFAPYTQSQRQPLYEAALRQLHAHGLIYPCHCSRKGIATAATAPHAADDEPVYPGTCRPTVASPLPEMDLSTNWRFRIPDGEAISFQDGQMGEQNFAAGRDFGDFPIWRKEGLPSYQLAVVVDDAAMRITEVVRGADLLISTARQILLYHALGLTPPAFYHCPLALDENGSRLSKRDGAQTLRSMREAGLRMML